MNYFAHALNYLDQPYFMAGTALPDWLSVVDRKVRLRPRLLEPWRSSADELHASVAAGAMQHLDDDSWFHSTRGFVEVTSELTHLFRTQLGPDSPVHCGFLGHVGMELLLDSVLIERFPKQFETYWDQLQAVNPELIQAAVNQMARVPTDRLAWFIDLYRREQFLRCYLDDHKLLNRLNQVLMRVQLTPMPSEAEAAIRDGRQLVQRRWRDLLPEEHFCLPKC
jgi:hypothetical protein